MPFPFPSRSPRITLLALLCATGYTTAQETPPTVRRAEVTDPPPRALPLDEEAPPPKAIPVTPNTEQPSRPPKKLATGAEGDLFSFSMLLFEKKQYKLAARQFEKYLESYQTGIHAEEALYRLGESLLNDGDVAGAEAAYKSVIRKYRSGDYSGYAAYRIGALAYTRKEYKSAIPYLSIAETKSPKKDIQVAAIYYRAMCLQLTGQTDKAVPLFQKIADLSDPSAFWQNSLLALARIHTGDKNDTKALDSYSKLIEGLGTNTDVRGEALVQSGLILTAQGQTDSANSYFEETLKLVGAREWKPLARYGLVDSYYKAKLYKEVIDVYLRTTDYILPPETRPQMMLMVANSYRFLKQYGKAIDLYLVIEQYYSDTEEGKEASYSKLVCFYNTKNPSLPRFVDIYVRSMQQRDSFSDLIDRALLLKAELLFQQENFTGAAAAYADIRPDKLPVEFRASAMFRRGYAEAEGGNPTAAISSFSDFLDRYPDDASAPVALAKRAMSYKDLGDLSKAIEDFDKLVESHPDSAPAELAYQQSALLKGQRRDIQGMISTFKAMLEKYPESKGAAEATFWIGWGHFEEKQYADAVPYLASATKLDPEEYFDRASLRTILAHYYLEDLDKVSNAINTYIKAKPQARISSKVLGWVGLKQFEAKNFLLAERYLMMASTPTEPRQTRAPVWLYLGKAKLKLGKFVDAISAYDHFLATTNHPAERGSALEERGRAQLGAKQYAEAISSAEEGLELQKQGRINARLWILRGDVEFAQGNYQSAVAKYVVPSQLFVDPKITPDAIHKTILAFEKLGENEKVQEFQEQLKEQFPDYEPPKVQPQTDEG